MTCIPGAMCGAMICIPGAMGGCFNPYTWDHGWVLLPVYLEPWVGTMTPRSHKLSLHPLKTKFMVFSNSQEVKNMDLNLFINCNNSNENDLANISPISRVNPTDDVPAVRFLGVFLSFIKFPTSH